MLGVNKRPDKFPASNVVRPWAPFWPARRIGAWAIDRLRVWPLGPNTGSALEEPGTAIGPEVPFETVTAAPPTARIAGRNRGGSVTQTALQALLDSRTIRREGVPRISPRTGPADEHLLGPLPVPDWIEPPDSPVGPNTAEAQSLGLTQGVLVTVLGLPTTAHGADHDVAGAAGGEDTLGLITRSTDGARAATVLGSRPKEQPAPLSCWAVT